MTVVSNPIATLVPVPQDAPAERPAQLADAIWRLALTLGRLIGLFEFHENVTVVDGGVGTVVPHGLGRVPRHVFITGISQARIIMTPWEQWTDQQIVLVASGGTPVVRFVLL